jgi:NADP-dependent 3-hydroxy acid dehydrogenase YdfG
MAGRKSKVNDLTWRPAMTSTAKTTIVTGASSGIGHATARRFAQAGYRVVAIARRLDRLEKLRAEFSERCVALAVDVSDINTLQRELNNLIEKHGAPDVLVNAAGVALGDAPAHGVGWDDWRRTIETNVLGLTAATHAVLPGMVERRTGDIVNIGSIAGTYPYPQGHVYGATKAFIHQFTLNLRADLAGLGVRAMCVEPGTTVTEFAAVRLGNDKEKLNEIYGNRRLLSAEDVAEVIHYLVTLPRHINVNTIEMMSQNQAFSFFSYAPDR